MSEIVKHEMNIDNTGVSITHNERELTPSVWQMLSQIGQSAYRAHLYEGITSGEAAAMVMLKGWELGFGVSSSFEFIKPIKNKFELIPRGALALLHGHPSVEAIRVTRLEDDKGNYIGHECYIKRTSGFEYTARWTLKDAERAGLLKPDSNYEKYPENMCLWRAIGFACDVAAPDLTSGMTTIMKMPEAYGVVVTEGGEVIEATWNEPAPQAAPEPPAPTPVLQAPKIEELAMKYGGEAVLLANEGRIPATEEELIAVANKLGGA